MKAIILIVTFFSIPGFPLNLEKSYEPTRAEWLELYTRNKISTLLERESKQKEVTFDCQISKQKGKYEMVAELIFAPEAYDFKRKNSRLERTANRRSRWVLSGSLVQLHLSAIRTENLGRLVSKITCGQSWSCPSTLQRSRPRLLVDGRRRTRHHDHVPRGELAPDR